MESFCELVRNALWHAFHALDESSEGQVAKSRLLVLTASLGNLLGCPNIEKGLPEFRSTPNLKYNEYLFYLEKELFEVFPEKPTAQWLNKVRHDLDDICWVVYKQKVCVSVKNLLPNSCYFHLFRIFCEISDLIESEKCSTVVLHGSELTFLMELFNDILGTTLESNAGFSFNFPMCTFVEFLAFMETNFIRCFEKEAFLEATEEVYKVVVENVLKQGYLKKFLTPVGPWWDLWFVLRQHTLSWSSSRAKVKLWGEVNFENSKVELANVSGCQISLVVDGKAMMLSAPDCATKLQWVTALKTALKHSETIQPFQRYCSAARKELRLKTEAKLKEEQHILEQKEEDLERQKRAKMQLEQELQKELEKQREFEIREKLLLDQLEEERQAKRDEEIVRNLQSRLLAEEWEKRESLEEEKKQQEAELLEERQKRKELELCQNQTQLEIEQMENEMSSLKKEKENLHGTLKRTKQLLNIGTSKESLNDSQHRMKRSLSADFSLAKGNTWTIAPTSFDDDDEC